MNIERHTSNECSMCPFAVETNSTGNWSIHSIWKYLGHAERAAEFLRIESPQLRIRVHHRTGGPCVIAGGKP
jgi:hypothetical protein